MTIKQRIQDLFFPLGSVQKIRVGYLKGCSFKLTTNSLWSPIIGNWEPAMQKIMVNIIKENSVVYDLGANNGIHGLLMARLVGEKGKVYNFEPLPSNLEEIEMNFRLNSISNYVNIHAAVFSVNGTQNFEIGDHAKQGFISDKPQNKSIAVPTITLDSFIDSGNPGPSFIKMDIEGAEGGALEGFEKHIDQFRPFMIIELHSPEQDMMVGQFLKKHSYEAYRFDTFRKLSFTRIRDLTKVFPDPNGIWGSIFCVPEETDFSSLTFDK
jgi:FkbM family methyltransferase